ncbi:SPOR domain-containing protein [Deinococcus fonticola]|uniref:SPOR domain-containing protein n=1 Tax=Deinococcus fonticola TaxID=2528713 RepID=UPI0010751C14|nr:SPOR domain-containing protein [Deinococcus fonticola]
MSGARPARTRTGSAGRWPDIMVGAVTLALLAGFGTLMFGERNQPLVAQAPAPSPQTATPSIPASPGTVPEPQTVQPPAAQPQPSQATPAVQGSAAESSAAPAKSQAIDPASGTAPTPAAQPPATEPPAASNPSELAQTSEIPPAPAAPAVTPLTPPVLPDNPTPQAATADPEASPPATATPPVPAPAVPARTGGAVATSESRVPLRSDYRISLGSFTTRKTVESQTANVRGLGYTVHAIDLGDQYVAQIGPFANEEAARQALADIQRAYPSALLYRPRNAPAASTANSAAASDTESSAASNVTPDTTQTTPARPQAAAPSGPAYLQVGAFDREDSAQRLVGILHDNGFNPTVNSPEGRKTTVMVGPYSGDALLRAEARLDNAGLDHFRVR